VPRWKDIRTLNKESFYERTGLQTVDIISGGFPCQPFSVAGNQKGKEDDRYLWPEMLRVVREFTPSYVIGENVPGILRIAGRTVCEDLEREGYTVTVFNFEAAAVGAKHRRERVFFCAVMENAGHGRREQQEILQKQPWRAEPVSASQGLPNREPTKMRENVADTESQQANRVFKLGPSPDIRTGGVGVPERCGLPRHTEWAAEPDVGRVANGIPSRVDRLKCLGNAVVPQQAYPIFKAIADIERGII
jgi:DNA (cytosine-5)-methyltransferase 1